MDDTQSKKITKSLGIGAYTCMGLTALLGSRIFGKKLGQVILRSHIGFGVLALLLATVHTAVTVYKTKKEGKEI